MAWLAVDKDGREVICPWKPERLDVKWVCEDYATVEWNKDNNIALPKGSIKKLTGIELTWGNEPIELKAAE